MVCILLLPGGSGGRLGKRAASYRGYICGDSAVGCSWHGLQGETESGTEINSGIAAESDTEITADDYGAVKVSELDYDSFQSRMTAEEWEGFLQYFPVLKENMPFHYAHFGNSTPLNKDGEPVREDEYKWRRRPLIRSR